MQNATIAHPHSPEHRRPPKEGWRSIMSTLLILLAAPFIAILVTAFIFQSYQVEGHSMETALQDRDRLIVWKLGKSWSNLTNSTFMPKRGEIIVFNRPHNAGSASEEDKQLIKRVIGLPGDRVVISGGTVTIYNKTNPDGFQPDQKVGYELADTNTNGEVDLTIKDGQVFVLGDNRGNSLDSRNFGAVDTGRIVGSLGARIYPFTKIDRL